MLPFFNNLVIRIKSIILKITRKKVQLKKDIKIDDYSANGFSGCYSSWKEANSYAIGYDANSILQKVLQALLKVKNGEAAYERDSVLFDEIQYSWGLLAGLERAAIENAGHLCVLDFGGSLGSSYYQNRGFLGGLKSLEWCIVEQEQFVKSGKEHFEDDQLKFYYTIDDSLKNHKTNVILLSGVLQYLEEPYKWIDVFIKLKVPYIIIDRTPFISSDTDILTIQRVPESIYKASYPAWFFGSKLIRSFVKDYKLIARFNNGFTPSAVINNKYEANWDGIILKYEIS
jgi:putative methyltransferase (TIGR04325 family)